MFISTLGQARLPYCNQAVQGPSRSPFWKNDHMVCVTAQVETVIFTHVCPSLGNHNISLILHPKRHTEYWIILVEHNFQAIGYRFLVTYDDIYELKNKVKEI